MHNWRNVLPTQSVCLRVPIVLPDEMEEQWAVRGRGDVGLNRFDLSMLSSIKSLDSFAALPIAQTGVNCWPWQVGERPPP